MLILPDEMREELARPCPTIYTDAPPYIRGKRVISVGDVCTITLYQSGIIPHLAVIDGRTRRSSHSGAEGLRFDVSIKVKNPQATITDELWDSIEKALKRQESTMIMVDGEEDLAALVCLSEADDGDIVVYGIPEKGMCIIDVSEETRKKARDVLSRMKKATEA